MSQYEEVLTASNVRGNITIESHHINIVIYGRAFYFQAAEMAS